MVKGSLGGPYHPSISNLCLSVGRVVGSHSIKEGPGWHLIWDAFQASLFQTTHCSHSWYQRWTQRMWHGTLERAATMTIPACLLLKHNPSFHISMPLLMYLPWKAPSLILPTEIIFIHHSLGWNATSSWKTSQISELKIITSFFFYLPQHGFQPLLLNFFQSPLVF